MPVGAHLAKAGKVAPGYFRNRARSERWFAICDGTLGRSQPWCDADSKVRTVLGADDPDVPNSLDPVAKLRGLRQHIDILRLAVS